jgi:hypothetical protein
VRVVSSLMRTVQSTLRATRSRAQRFGAVISGGRT